MSGRVDDLLVSGKKHSCQQRRASFKLLFQQTVADHFSREAEIAKEVALANAPPLRT
jgi:hypothetical protein